MVKQLIDKSYINQEEYVLSIHLMYVCSGFKFYTNMTMNVNVNVNVNMNVNMNVNINLYSASSQKAPLMRSA